MNDLLVCINEVSWSLLSSPSPRVYRYAAERKLLARQLMEASLGELESSRLPWLVRRGYGHGPLMCREDTVMAKCAVQTPAEALLYVRSNHITKVYMNFR